MAAPDVVPIPKSPLLPFSDIHVSWNTVRKRARLPEVQMHDLRHNFASHLVHTGHSIFVVSKTLGHVTPLDDEALLAPFDKTLLAAATVATANTTMRAQCKTVIRRRRKLGKMTCPCPIQWALSLGGVDGGKIWAA